MAQNPPRPKTGKKRTRKNPRVARSELRKLVPNLCWPSLEVKAHQESDGLVDLNLQIHFERDAPRKFVRDVLEEEFSLLLTRLLYQIEEEDLKILFNQLKKMGFQTSARDTDKRSTEEIITFLRTRGVPRSTLREVRSVLTPPAREKEDSSE